MAHTPGPWRVEVDTTLVWGACVINDGAPDYLGYPVADAQLARAWNRDGLPTVDEALTNARLIAAAPDMLRALTDIREYFEREFREGDKAYQAVIIARDAIAKAEAA